MDSIQIRPQSPVHYAKHVHFEETPSTSMVGPQAPKIRKLQEGVTSSLSGSRAKEINDKLKAYTITVGILKYTFDQAKVRLKSVFGTTWVDEYEVQLTYLFSEGKRFNNINELADNLFYWKRDADEFNLHKTGISAGLTLANDEFAINHIGWEALYKYEPGQGSTLHDLVYNVISSEDVITGMSYDNINKRKAKTQLAICLSKCRDYDESTLALCLYTSYFYEPLNNYFRGLSTPDESTSFGKLIVKTAKVLEDSYEVQADAEITETRYRLELKSGWLKDSATSIDFKALTSTHPNIHGVKGMWENVADGSFGPFDDFALLAFEGTAKIKHPVRAAKYFVTEEEDLLGPGSKYKVVEKYEIEGDIPGIGRKVIRVFHLSNLDKPKAITRLSFSDIVPRA